MIGKQDITNSSKRPNMPLEPLFAFRGSPLTLKITGAPGRVGKFAITGLSVQATYPDGTTEAVACVDEEGTWLATLPGTETPGRAPGGLAITGSGTDEHGDPVEGYVLGTADINILDSDGTVAPGTHLDAMHIFALQPTEPKFGDVCKIGGTWKVYNGTAWEPFGSGGGTGDYDELDNRPQINGVTLTGDKTPSALGLASTQDLTGKMDCKTPQDTAGDYYSLYFGLNEAVGGTYPTLRIDKNGPGGIFMGELLLPHSPLGAPAFGTLALTTDIPTQLSQLGQTRTSRLCSDTEKATWNGKYSKPTGGIPATDLASSVQTTLASVANKVDKETGKGIVDLGEEDGVAAAANAIVDESLSLRVHPVFNSQDSTIRLRLEDTELHSGPDCALMDDLPYRKDDIGMGARSRVVLVLTATTAQSVTLPTIEATDAILNCDVVVNGKAATADFGLTLVGGTGVDVHYPNGETITCKKECVTMVSCVGINGLGWLVASCNNLSVPTPTVT